MALNKRKDTSEQSLQTIHESHGYDDLPFIAIDEQDEDEEAALRASTKRGMKIIHNGRAYSPTEFHDRFGVVVIERQQQHRLRNFWQQLFNLPVWMYPSIVDDHDHAKSGKNYDWGYTPAKRYRKRGYHENCKTCKRKEHFSQFRFWSISVVLAVSLLILDLWGCVVSAKVAAITGITMSVVLVLGMVGVVIGMIWMMTEPL